MTKVQDQGWVALGASLETLSAPYNPFDKSGDPDDPARYLARPGVDFLRPWLAVSNGFAFQWPLGLEGYNLTIDPTLGIHKFIGDNAVVVDVLHAGEEHFTMSGTFPGSSASDLIQALRDVVYQSAPDDFGKILYIPSIFTFAQRVHVNHAEFNRDAGTFGDDASYSIEFVRIGTTKEVTGNIAPVTTSAPKGKGARNVKTTSTYNTLRKVAAWKLGSALNWRSIYNLNELYFTKKHIPLSQAQGFRLPIGTTLYF